uniref:Uncharacterized protein n=1 Tax=Arundo donax TaxID=35708 RepID=A0A0A9F2B9_ARUDO
MYYLILSDLLHHFFSFFKHKTLLHLYVVYLYYRNLPSVRSA